MIYRVELSLSSAANYILTPFTWPPVILEKTDLVREIISAAVYETRKLWYSIALKHGAGRCPTRHFYTHSAGSLDEALVLGYSAFLKWVIQISGIWLILR